ncbi:uncharacterized protein [Henckelia pumila]|uniref:uncharacterized protein n=1 Tax=Henckelia pumila TaxID=405737 RepID=UPI003C6E400B
MEMAKAITFLLLLLLALPAAVYGATIPVGGGSGWTLGVDYVSWAKGQVFTIKDVLLFNYGPSHSVEEVSDSDYRDCNVDNPIASYSTSPTSIPLSSTGTRYFICPTSTHCSQGMKLAVTVTDGSNTAPPPAPSTTIPPPPPGTASPVPPSTPASPPPTPSTSSPPPRTTASPPPTPSPSSPPPPRTTPTPSPIIAPKSSSPPPTTTTPPPKSNSTRSPPPSGSPLAPTSATPPPAPSHGTILAGQNSIFIGILLVLTTFFGLIG